MFPTTFKRDIGIVGLAWSGKTVFLTSLIHHLENHDPKKFRLVRSLKPKKQPAIKHFSELPPKNIQRFNKIAHWSTLLDKGTWPEKTTDISAYRCTFRRSDWLRPVDLTFLDFPGERFADAVMLGRTYEEWSDFILDLFKSDVTYGSLAQPYLHLQGGSQCDHSELINTYKETLARLYLNHRPLISPSIFVLDQRGSTIRTDDIRLIQERHLIGLDAQNEFVPLGRSLREKHPDLAKQYASRYEHYQSQIVKASFSHLQRCHRLIVLIDVTNILASQMGRLNDCETIVDHILEASVKKRRNLARRLGMLALLPTAWRPRGISRIAFVATKSDLIHSGDADNLLNLLKSIGRTHKLNYDVHIDHFTCAAIRSTEFRDGQLLGFPTYTPEGSKVPPPQPTDKMLLLNPDRVPSDWPTGWHPHIFPEVHPRIPRRKTDVPAQESLDKILDFILAETFTE